MPVPWPNAFIIGAQKAGTTALANLLDEHPDAFLCEGKEPHYFSFHESFGLPWYLSLFERGADAAVRLDASTSYTMWPVASEVPEQIAKQVPDARLVYLLRDPVARAAAAYRHALGGGSEGRSIRDALLCDARYLHASSYAMQLERYLAHFDREQILVLRQDALLHEPAATLDLVLTHLGLPAGWRPPSLGQRFNEAPTRRPRPWWQSTAAAARRVAPSTTFKLLRRVDRDWRPFFRPIRDDEVTLPADVAAVLEELLQDDLQHLRDLLGPGWDWGRLRTDSDRGRPAARGDM